MEEDRKMSSTRKKLLILISVIGFVVILTFLISLLGYKLINRNVRSIEDNNNKQAVISEIHNNALKQQLGQYSIIINSKPEKSAEIEQLNQKLRNIISQYRDSGELSQDEIQYLTNIERNSTQLLKNFEEKILPEIERNKRDELRKNLLQISENMADIYQRELQLKNGIFSIFNDEISKASDYIQNIDTLRSESINEINELEHLSQYYSAGIARLRELNSTGAHDTEEIAAIVDSLEEYLTEVKNMTANIENRVDSLANGGEQSGSPKLSSQTKMLEDVHQLIEWTNKMHYSMLEAAFVRDADFTAYNNAATRVDSYIENLSQSLSGTDKNLILAIKSLNDDNRDKASLVIAEVNRSRSSSILSNVDHSISLLDQIDKASSELAENVKQYISDSISRSKKLQASIIIILSIIILVSISIGMLLAVTVRNTIFHVRKMTKMIERAEKGDLPSTVQIIDDDVLGELSYKVKNMLDRNKKVADDVLSAEKDIDFLKRNLELMSNESKEKISNISRGYYSTVNTIKGSMRGLKEPTKDVSKLVEGVKNMSDVTQKVVGDSMRAMEIAANSGKVIAEVERTVKNVTESIGNVTDTIGELEKKSRQIGHATNEISDVSVRLGILTSNAAIEAQKPSFNNRDCIIVIEEMGKLARQSNELIKEVKDLVKQTQSDVYRLIDGMSSGVYGVGESVEKINAVKMYIGDVVMSMKMIVDAMKGTADEVKEYVVSTSDFANFIGSFNRSVQESTADSEHIRKNIEEQNAIVKEMETLSRMLENTSNKLETVTEGYKIYSNYIKNKEAE